MDGLGGLDVMSGVVVEYRLSEACGLLGMGLGNQYNIRLKNQS